MKLPRPKKVDLQGELFRADRLLQSPGEARWATGEFFEQAVVHVTGAARLKTDATCDICPDLQQSEDLFFESKGVGRGASVILYECRVVKDQKFMQSCEKEIVYWFWHHTYPVLQATTYDNLRDNLASATRNLYVVDAGLLQESVKNRPTRKVNSAYTSSGDRLGYGQNGYGIGWTIRLSWFRERTRQLDERLSLRVYRRHSIADVNVYVSRPEFKALVFPPKSQLQLNFSMSQDTLI